MPWVDGICVKYHHSHQKAICNNSLQAALCDWQCSDTQCLFTSVVGCQDTHTELQWAEIALMGLEQAKEQTSWGPQHYWSQWRDLCCIADNCDTDQRSYITTSLLKDVCSHPYWCVVSYGSAHSNVRLYNLSSKLLFAFSLYWCQHERPVSKYCTAVHQLVVSKIIQQLQSINQSLAGHVEKMDG